MKKLRHFFFWFFICFAVIVGIDQLLCRMPAQHPTLKVTQQFYTDFRSRLLGINQPRTIDAVIERESQPGSSPVSPAGSARFLYKDATGQLQFADSLDDVPAPYRENAKPLDP